MEWEMAKPKIKRYKNSFYTITFSPDDGGFYASIFDRKGRDLHSTAIRGTRSRVEIETMEWIAKNKKGKKNG